MTFYSSSYIIDPKAKHKHYWKYWSGIDGNILDIGCTTGNFIQWRPENIIGVDFDLTALRFAKKRGFEVTCGNVVNGLSFSDNTFSGVNCSAVLEHLTDPLSLLQEIRRVLEPEGKLVALVPDIKRYKFDYWRDYTHKTPFTREGLQHCLVDAGFKDFTITRYVFNYLKYLPGAQTPRYHNWLDLLERPFAWVLSRDFAVEAFK